MVCVIKNGENHGIAVWLARRYVLLLPWLIEKRPISDPVLLGTSIFYLEIIHRVLKSLWVQFIASHYIWYPIVALKVENRGKCDYIRTTASHNCPKLFPFRNSVSRHVLQYIQHSKGNSYVPQHYWQQWVSKDINKSEMTVMIPQHSTASTVLIFQLHSTVVLVFLIAPIVGFRICLGLG